MATVSASAQDYLKEIFKLQAEAGRVTTSALAERLRVAPPSVTSMVKKLATLGLATHEPYRGVLLTARGRAAAVETIRHHRLLEQYLAQALGLPIDQVHGEAERLEHALSEEVEARIDETLGYPTQDPHGHPIPDARLRMTDEKVARLADCRPGQQATVVRVPDGDSALLRYLAERGLLPGAEVAIVDVATVGGLMTVRTDEKDVPVSLELAGRIGVTYGG